MFKALINFLTGYVDVEIEGYYIEKFINTCMNRGIYLWGINRKMATVLDAKIATEDIEQAREVAKKNQCIITEKNKRGVPFLWNKYKKRKAFFISLFVSMLIVFTLSKFVWNIEVVGTEKIDKKEIIEEAKNYGLKIGMLKSKINTDNLINRIRIDKNGIAWIGVEIKGTNAIIKVVEADEKPDIVDENDYCNIVANKDGEITKIYASNGTVMVKEGDHVKKGDILIGGWMEGLYTGKQYVNGNGVIKAKIKYSESKKIDKKEIKREQTGKKERKISLKINNFKINFYKRLSKFKKYDTIYSEKKLKLFSNFYLPISFVLYTNYEVNEVEQNNDYDRAKTYGEQEIKKKMDTLISGEIINSTTDVMEYDTYYNIIVTYEVIEEIGTKEKIYIERMG